MPLVRRQVSPHAARLRREMTDVERMLWAVLRNRRLDDLKFRRQATIGPFIADFVCVEAALVVELDGGQHDEHADAARAAFIEAQGYHVLRFWNGDVIANLKGVVEAITEVATSRRPSPNPLPQAGEG